MKRLGHAIREHLTPILIVAVAPFAIAAALVLAAQVEHSHATSQNQLERSYADYDRLWESWQACRAAADVGDDLNAAWHTWLGDKTQEHVDQIHDLQDGFGQLLDDCRTVRHVQTYEGSDPQ